MSSMTKPMAKADLKRKIESLYDCSAGELEHRREQALAEFHRQLTDPTSQLWKSMGGYPAGGNKELLSAPKYIYLILATADRVIPDLAEVKYPGDLTIPKAAKILADHGWWIFPNLTVDFCYELVKHEHEVTTETVTSAIIEYASYDGYAIIEEMIAKWSDPVFHRRHHIFDDALSAHRQGWYTLSIPALLPQVEGIIREKLGDVLGEFTWRFETTYTRFCNETPTISELPERDHGYYSRGEVEAVANDVVLSAVNKLFDNFDPSQEYRSAVLNRHAVCHGRWLSYHTLENSTRLFLLLDALHDLLWREWPSSGKDVTP